MAKNRTPSSAASSRAGPSSDVDMATDDEWPALAGTNAGSPAAASSSAAHVVMGAPPPPPPPAPAQPMQAAVGAAVGPLADGLVRFPIFGPQPTVEQERAREVHHPNDLKAQNSSPTIKLTADCKEIIPAYAMGPDGQNYGSMISFKEGDPKSHFGATDMTLDTNATTRTLNEKAWIAMVDTLKTTSFTATGILKGAATGKFNVTMDASSLLFNGNEQYVGTRAVVIMGPPPEYVMAALDNPEAIAYDPTRIPEHERIRTSNGDYVSARTLVSTVLRNWMQAVLFKAPLNYNGMMLTVLLCASSSVCETILAMARYAGYGASAKLGPAWLLETGLMLTTIAGGRMGLENYMAAGRYLVYTEVGNLFAKEATDARTLNHAIYQKKLPETLTQATRWLECCGFTLLPIRGFVFTEAVARLTREGRSNAILAVYALVPDTKVNLRAGPPVALAEALAAGFDPNPGNGLIVNAPLLPPFPYVAASALQLARIRAITTPTGRKYTFTPPAAPIVPNVTDLSQFL